GWGLFKILFLNARYGPTTAMLMTLAVLTFVVGLVSEQVTTLLYASSARAAEAAQAEIEKEVRDKADEG
ncbi:hypothetical protein, partial [Oceanidesulfovibrio marinus]